MSSEEVQKIGNLIQTAIAEDQSNKVKEQIPTNVSGKSEELLPVKISK